MINDIKYVHTNIIARDWKKLARFYIDVFGCEPTYPERDLSGEWIEKMTRIEDVHLRGIHLKLPGYENGPTLEIFQYNKSGKDDAPSVNDLGFGHMAFHVGNVEQVIDKIIAKGGNRYGELIEKDIPGVGILKAIYMLDPENNIIEIQHWKGK